MSRINFDHNRKFFSKTGPRFVKIMVPGGQVALQQGNSFSHVFILEKSSSPESASQFQLNFVQIILG
jgi:hypothetical protein